MSQERLQVAARASVKDFTLYDVLTFSLPT